MPTLIRPAGVHHLAVIVDDLSRAEGFYCGVLGLTATTRWADAEGAPRSVWVDLGGGAFLAIEKAPRPRSESALQAPDTSSDSPPGWHCVVLAIQSEDRDAWRRRLEAAGHRIVRETDFTLYVRDPEDNLVGFSHYPDRAERR